MATDYRAKGYQSGIGALIEGLSSGSDDWAENKFKRNQEIEKRRFEMAKLAIQDQNTQRRHEENMNLRRELASIRSQKGYGKAPKIDPNELVAMTTGKFTPQMQESFGNLSQEDQISIIRELAKQKGFRQSGEREEETKEGGFLGLGAKTVKRKYPTYASSENQFGR